MPKIIGQVDSRAVLAKLKQLEDMGRDFREPMNQAGLYMMRETEKNFRSQKSPDGSAWSPLADSTQAKRRKWKKSQHSNRTLQDTGTLMNSLINQSHSNAIFRVSQHSVELGTNVPYAGVHQFGGSTGAFTIKPKNKKALRWMGVNGHFVFARSVKHPGFQIPARPFLGINEKNQDAINRIFNIWADKELKK